MAAPITYKRLVLSGDKAKETANEVKTKMSKDWKRDFPDGSLDIKPGVEGKIVIDIKTKESSSASLASKIKDIATRNKVNVVIKDKPTLTAVEKIKIDNNKKNNFKDLNPDELERKLKNFGLDKKDDDDDYDKPTIKKLFTTVKDTIDTARKVNEDQSYDELMKKIKSSLTHQVTGGKKGKPGLKETLNKNIAIVFLKYKDKSFPMDYKPGSMFAKFVSDLEKSGAFSSEDEVSDFMSSEEFDNYANKFNVEIDYADYDPTPLSLAPKQQMEPQDMIPGRAPKDFVSADIPHRMTDLFEKLKKTGKLKKSELTEIIKKYKK